MHNPPPPNIINRPRPTPRNNLPFKRPTNPTKQHQQRHTPPKNDAKSLPITPHLKLHLLELNAKVASHQRHWGKQDCDLSQEESNPCESLNGEGLLDGDEVKVHHHERFFLVETFVDFAEGVEQDSIFQTLKANACRRTECYAKQTISFRDERARRIVYHRVGGHQ